MHDTNSDKVLVQVVEIGGGREIGRVADLAEQLGERTEDIRRAIAAGTRAITDSLPDLPSAKGWSMGEVTAKFGITLTAEAGAIVSRASAGATFEVSVTYQRDPR